MLHQLPPDKFSMVHPLFDKLTNHHLFCAGVLAQKIPGKVVVDSLENPRSAMVFKPGMWCYLGGDSNNTKFNEALGEALTAKKLVGEDPWGLLFMDPSESWRKVLKSLIEDRQPIATPRFLYLANEKRHHVPDSMPDGFSLHFIDAALKEKVKGDLPDDVQDVLDLRANSQNPDHFAFGYVALHDQSCVSWSMVDCIVGTHGELGLQTKSAYQRRGLGLAVSEAVIGYGLSNGLTTIHWDVINHNIPSIRMAEKLGLRLERGYDQDLIVFGEVSYLINLAWDHLDRGRFQETVDTCNQLFELNNGKAFGHFLSGAAWAGMNHKEKAFDHLNNALDHGWDNLMELENCSPLTILHETKEWQRIITRLKANIDASGAT